MKIHIYKGIEFQCNNPNCNDGIVSPTMYWHAQVRAAIDHMTNSGYHYTGILEFSKPEESKSEYIQQSAKPVLECKWFHGVRTDSIKTYAQHGIVPKEKLRELGFDAYHDSKPRTVYVTSKLNTAVGFANSNYDKLKGYHGNPQIILCMGAIRVDRKDRNGDIQAVEVRKRIRPEYLRVHNYQGIIGLCWPLLWVAKENGWSFDVS